MTYRDYTAEELYELYELYAERAAIIEHDAGKPKGQAAIIAANWLRKHIQPLPVKITEEVKRLNQP